MTSRWVGLWGGGGCGGVVFLAETMGQGLLETKPTSTSLVSLFLVVT